MTAQLSQQSQSAQSDNSYFIRMILKANAAFSMISGGAFLVAAAPIAEFLGLSAPVVLTVSAFLLLIFAGDLFFLATRKTINPRFVAAIIAADVLWVVGSIILLIMDPVPFTTAGKWAIGIVAAVVALFAELEFYGLRKMD